MMNKNYNVTEGSRNNRNEKNKKKQNLKISDLKMKLINSLHGVVNAETLKMKYYKPLPNELEVWYVYLLDGGHNIFVMLEQFENEITSTSQTTYADQLIPCPVKTVLNGYRINSDGIVVVSGLEYSFGTGLIVPEDDFEYHSKEKADAEDFEKIKNQRQQILMIIAQHCAYIRLSCYGQGTVEFLDNTGHVATYPSFIGFVKTHLQLGGSRASLRIYETELLNLINMYEERINNEVDDTFLSDNGWLHFFETYMEFITHAKNIKL